MATWLEKLRKIDERNKEQEKLAREMTHQVKPSKKFTPAETEYMWKNWNVPHDVAYGEKGLEGGVPTDPYLGLSPLDLIPAGAGAKLAALAGKGGIALAGIGGIKSLGSNATLKTEYELAHELAQRNAALPAGLHDVDHPAIRNAYYKMLMDGDRPTNRFGDKIAPTEGEIRHAVANHNSVFPVDQGGLGLPPNNTAIERAQAPAYGVDVGMPLYHGTNKDFPEFKLFEGDDTTRSVSRSPVGKLGVSLALDPALGNEFASRAGGEGMSVIPVLHRADKKGRITLDGSELNSDIYGAVVDAQKLGINGLMFDNYTTPLNNNQKFILAQNPNQIRSRFAAFDPFQRNSANILAGTALGGVGLSTLANYPQDEYY